MRKRRAQSIADRMRRRPWWYAAARVPIWVQLPVAAAATVAVSLVGGTAGAFAAGAFVLVSGGIEYAAHRAERAELEAEWRKPRTPSILEAGEQLRIQTRIRNSIDRGLR